MVVIGHKYVRGGCIIVVEAVIAITFDADLLGKWHYIFSRAGIRRELDRIR